MRPAGSVPRTRPDAAQADFQREQMRTQCLARLREGRPLPADTLARAFFVFKGQTSPAGLDDPRAPLHDPEGFVAQLPREQLPALRSQLQKFKGVFDREATDELFWAGFELLAGAREGCTAQPSPDVAQRVEAIIEGKTREQLSRLRGEVGLELEGTAFATDREFWEAVLLRVRRAEALLSLEEFRVREEERERSIPHNVVPADDDEPLLEAAGEVEPVRSFAAFADAHNEKMANAFLAKLIAQAAPRSLPAQGVAALVASFPGVPRSAVSPWTGPYCSLRPHFFVRVKLGYEWNSFNRGRYSKEDPPPRSVYGYRFSVFFPEKLTADPPRYSLRVRPDPALADLVFEGGPPYEPLGFAVVHAPWDMADRKNFKCVFEDGVFHLHFDFLRARAKR